MLRILPYPEESEGPRGPARILLLSEMIDLEIRQRIESGEGLRFSARQFSRPLGADKFTVAAYLDKLAKKGVLSRRVKVYHSDNIAVPVYRIVVTKAMRRAS